MNWNEYKNENGLHEASLNWVLEREVGGLSRYSLDLKTFSETHCLYPSKTFNRVAPIINLNEIETVLEAINNTSPEVSGTLADQLIFKYPVEEIYDSKTIGIGEIASEMYLTYTPFNMKLYVTSKQLACSNMLPKLSSDECTVFKYTADTPLQEFVEKVQGFNRIEFLTNQVNILKDTLHSPLPKNITPEFLFNRIYRVNLEKKPKFRESIMNSYYNAPNALPGTCIGILNAITHNSSRKDSTPIGKGNSLRQKAFKVLKEIKEVV